MTNTDREQLHCSCTGSAYIHYSKSLQSLSSAVQLLDLLQQKPPCLNNLGWPHANEQIGNLRRQAVRVGGPVQQCLCLRAPCYGPVPRVARDPSGLPRQLCTAPSQRPALTCSLQHMRPAPRSSQHFATSRPTHAPLPAANVARSPPHTRLNPWSRQSAARAACSPPLARPNHCRTLGPRGSMCMYVFRERE